MDKKDRNTAGFLQSDTKQIIILGNGFDLQCGIHTSYSGFFNDYFSEILFLEKTEDERTIYQVIENSALTKNFWFNYFFREHLKQIKGNQYNQKRLWSNVEETITDVVIQLNQIYEAYLNNVEVDIEIKTLLNKDPDDIDEEELKKPISSAYRRLLAKYIHCDAEEEILQALSCLNYSDLAGQYAFGEADLFTIKNEFFEKIFEHLIEFEDAFKSYIKNQMNDDYYDKAYFLYKDIVLDSLEESDGFHEYYSDVFFDYLSDNIQVLSFNYTQPHSYHFGTLNNKRNYAGHFLNIHGSINSNILIGIDEQTVRKKVGEVIDQDGFNLALFAHAIYRFTKTYRDTQFNSKGLDFSVIPQYIKIYGQCLGFADYSYFFSIFDAVNLYSSNTTIVFYYDRDHYGDEVSDHIIREIATDRIYMLIKSYGSTFDNKDHGFNLYHKLLVEGRLFVKEVTRRNE